MQKAVSFNLVWELIVCVQFWRALGIRSPKRRKALGYIFDKTNPGTNAWTSSVWNISFSCFFSVSSDKFRIRLIPAQDQEFTDICQWFHLCDRPVFYGAVVHLLRMMSEPQKEQESTIPNMSNSRHILILHGMMVSRNKCVHSMQAVSSFFGEVLSGSSLMQGFLLTLTPKLLVE